MYDVPEHTVCAVAQQNTSLKTVWRELQTLPHHAMKDFVVMALQHPCTLFEFVLPGSCSIGVTMLVSFGY